MKSWVRIAVLLLCACGALLSAVSLYNHYAATASQYCDLSRIFNCDLVNRSRYSVFLGIPVALIGLVGYVVLAALTLSRQRWARLARAGAASLGFAFALYLTYIEEMVLGTWCLLCLGSLAAITGISVLAALDLTRPRAVTAPI